MKKSTKTILARKISDHWKERAIKIYALQLIRHSVYLLLMLIGLCIFAIVLVFGFEVISEKKFDSLGLVSSFNGQLALIVVASIYGFFRIRLTK